MHVYGRSTNLIVNCKERSEIMPRKHRPRPDTRPDWRDPDMPVLREYRMANGRLVTEIDPEYERRYREFKLHDAIAPTFRNDPTYNLRRRKP